MVTSLLPVKSSVVIKVWLLAVIHNKTDAVYRCFISQNNIPAERFAKDEIPFHFTLNRKEYKGKNILLETMHCMQVYKLDPHFGNESLILLCKQHMLHNNSTAITSGFKACTFSVTDFLGNDLNLVECESKAG